MDVSDKKQRLTTEAGGEELIDQLVEFSRLPEDEVKSELDNILQQAGCESERLTLDELRAAMLNYLETFQQEMEAEGELSDLPKA